VDLCILLLSLLEGMSFFLRVHKTNLILIEELRKDDLVGRNVVAQNSIAQIDVLIV